MGRRVAQALYRVRLGYVDSEGLAKIDPDATVVFVMNHRSNMDYVLAGYLAADQAALSYAVGEWARIWPLSQPEACDQVCVGASLGQANGGRLATTTVLLSCCGA